MGVGMPGALKLDEFGSHVMSAFDAVPYHVGSSMKNKSGWRDVDVRVLLEDEKYDAMNLGHPGRQHRNEKWVALCLAFSALGKEMTGLPIDFQIQRMSEANEEFGSKDHPRSAIGFVPLRMAKEAPSEK